MAEAAEMAEAEMAEAEAAAIEMDSRCGGRDHHQVMATCDDSEAVVVAALTMSLEA
jgi:hypothetical protein